MVICRWARRTCSLEVAGLAFSCSTLRWQPRVSCSHTLDDVGLGIVARKLATVHGKGVAYHAYNWAMSASSLPFQSHVNRDEYWPNGWRYLRGWDADFEKLYLTVLSDFQFVASSEWWHVFFCLCFGKQQFYDPFALLSCLSAFFFWATVSLIVWHFVELFFFVINYSFPLMTFLSTYQNMIYH